MNGGNKKYIVGLTDISGTPSLSYSRSRGANSVGKTPSIGLLAEPGA